MNKPERRGGARPGSGPKPLTLSVKQVKAMLRREKKFAKKYGKSIDDICLAMIYGSDLKGNPYETDNKEKIACMKLWKEYTLAKMVEGGTTDKALAPAIFLPSQRPVLRVVESPKAG